MDAVPLTDDDKRAELRFGLLKEDESGSIEQELKGVGFGSKDYIIPFRKGSPYY
jgi:hypothetical protein